MENPIKAEQFLRKGEMLLKARGKTYDTEKKEERSADRTATAFNAITGHSLTGPDVWLLLQVLKDVRQWTRTEYHQDSAEDSVAYAALKSEALAQSAQGNRDADGD